jgi:hypothetical protein
MPGVFIGALGAMLVATGVWNVDSSTRPWPSGGPHDGDVRSDAVQPDELVHPFTLDGCLALQFQAQLDEERDSSREILDHNAGVIHPVDRHATQSRFGADCPVPELRRPVEAPIGGLQAASERSERAMEPAGFEPATSALLVDFTRIGSGIAPASSTVGLAVDLPGFSAHSRYICRTSVISRLEPSLQDVSEWHC